jgi:hypothetical protein
MGPGRWRGFLAFAGNSGSAHGGQGLGAEALGLARKHLKNSGL